jgi:malate-CoA ligase subunit beta
MSILIDERTRVIIQGFTGDKGTFHGREMAAYGTNLVGGGASPERIATALKLVLSDQKVRAVLVNIFAGINRCDWVAQGVVQAARGLKVPLIVRLAGTNVEAGQKIVRDSGLPIITADSLAEAAQRAVQAAREFQPA